MSLGLGIVVAMILYLVDRNKVWKQFAITVAALVVLGLVGLGGVFGWGKYQEHKAEIAEAKRAAQMKECVKGKLVEMEKAQSLKKGDIFDQVAAAKNKNGTITFRPQDIDESQTDHLNVTLEQVAAEEACQK